MRKKLLLFVMSVMVTGIIQAGDKWIADYETVLPKSDTADSPLVLTRNFTNPSQGGINNSSKVVKIYKPSGLGSASLGYQVVFDSLKLQLYPVL
ncbi:MAG: hypothetical protein N2662_02880, partial [Bacteroidales bacterium]|nr:hypothetical protein [Bacteroidales bacterium]